jgi:hypothetical protein
MLVLLMGRIHDVCRWNYLKWHDTYILSFTTISSGIQEILRVSPQQFERLLYWYYSWNGCLQHAIQMASGVDDISTKFHDERLRSSSNIKGIISTIWGYSVGITDERIYDVRCWNGLKWHDILTEFHNNCFKHLSNITVIAATIWEVVMLALPFEGTYEDWYRCLNNIKVLPQKFEGL